MSLSLCDGAKDKSFSATPQGRTTLDAKYTLLK